ncbi:hypothetical protein F4801DRAFT_359388 [Xylaria longipes]|nr:hypothetical protein F4801DRAFT_359388 [Xylaria longipes]RYC56510.1 hypothetical protein CHU98_g9695 [Xylaria longipes]
MTPRKMDHESAQRIARARGENDSFTRRAQMTVRNNDDSNESKQADGSSEKQNVEEKKKGDDENTKSESGQDSQDV